MLTFKFPMQQMKEHFLLGVGLVLEFERSAYNESHAENDDIKIVFSFSSKHYIHLFDTFTQLLSQCLELLHIF